MAQSDDFESSIDSLPIRLEAVDFQGPLDLLMHLIKKHEVNIYDIPIALITQQYLDTINLMQELDLDIAGEFLVMAATLIHIKSKMLLPRPETSAVVAGDDDDPRDMHERVAKIAGDDFEPELEVDLFSLLLAFQSVVQRTKARPTMVLPPEEMPVELRIEQLLDRLSETEACGFEDLFADVGDKPGLIVTFLALLEMIRLKLVRVFQSGGVGPIRVYKRPRPADAPHPIGDPEAHRG